MNDSKELWLGLRARFTDFDVRFGPASSGDYVNDPKHLVFVGARYKFAAKMVEGLDTVIEIGCGDAFGAPILAQAVGRLICTDIDEETRSANEGRCAFVKNLSFEYFDFRAGPHSAAADAAVLVDVLEHIYPEEEDAFLTNIVASLNPAGIAVIGTPNITAEKYSSPNSKIGHVNLKDHKSLRAACHTHFHNVFMFSMNDEVVHTGYAPMAHYIWAVCAHPRTSAG